MGINFPTSLDALTNPTPTDYLNSPSHSGQHADANDAIEAIQAKLGINSSAVTTSHDYKLSGVTGSDKAASLAGSETLSNKSLASPIIDYIKGWGGWLDAAETWVFSSADGATGIFNVAANVVSKYTEGMRIKYTQLQALTAYWNLDANSNSQVGSFNGTDTAITYQAGKFSNGALFNGTTSKIAIADNASLKPTSEYTLGLWFKKSSTGNTKTLFQSYSANPNAAGIKMFVDTDNALHYYHAKNNQVSPNYHFVGTTNVADNAWHYVVVSFRSNYLQIYLDGNLEISGYAENPAYAATNYVRIGASNNTGTDAALWDNMIDDVFLINGYALDEKTIKAQYDAQAAQGTGSITVQKYGIITNVGSYSGGNTPITVWGGTDHDMVNSTISDPYYASVKAPVGFPLSEEKWKVEVKDIVGFTQASPVASQWYNANSIVVPIGAWRIEYQGTFSIVSTAAQTSLRIFATLSSASTTESDPEFTIYGGLTTPSGSLVSLQTARKSKPIKIKTKKTMYLNLMSNTGAAAVARILTSASGSPTILRANCSYL